MKLLYTIGLLMLCTGCATRMIPPEVTAISDSKRAYSPSLPIKRPEKIVIDAGHGGRDAGASSKRDEYEEKALTLKTALLVQEHLKKLGYQTTLTRNQDTYVPLNTRAEIANDLDADLFVSIHYNFSASSDVEGVEVYYYKEEKHPSAERIVKSKLLAHKVINSITTHTGAASRGVKQANFAVIRETLMPAILIEAGFLSNVQERERLRDPEYLRYLSWGIAKGVDKFLTK